MRKLAVLGARTAAAAVAVAVALSGWLPASGTADGGPLPALQVVSRSVWALVDVAPSPAAVPASMASVCGDRFDVRTPRHIRPVTCAD